MRPDVTYEEAVRRVLAAVEPVGAETVPLEDCYGRVLAEAVAAEADVPPFDRSPYDGYALRAADTADASPEAPVTLHILEEIPAGGVPHFTVTAGTAAKVLTGAPIPEGADAVIMFEKTEFTGSRVTISAPLRGGENIVRAGEDIRKGAVLARRGQRLDAGLLGVLASQGRTAAAVYRRPLVGLISTGSELVPPGGDCAPGQIFDSNRYTLAGALTDSGCVPVCCGVVRDDAASIAGALGKALEGCDAVVLTGGVSVGDYDLTPAAMEAAGAEILFHGCAVKPGMACAYGTRDGKLICALSGNPASAVTNFYLIARPALRKLCGREDCLPDPFPVTLAEGFDKKSPVTRLLRGRLDLSDGTAKMRLPKDQGNVVLSSTVGCNVMAVVPAGSGPLPAGTRLEGFLL